MEIYQPHCPDLSPSVTCRLIKVSLDNDKTEVLCTSLLDKQKYPIEDFKELYHLRWAAEEGFKMFKSRIQIEAFTGRTALSIKQDIYAKTMMMSLCAAFAFPIEEKVKREYKDSKAPQKINRTSAYAFTKNIAISLLIKQKVNQAIEAFDKIVYKTKELVRLGRSNPRKHKPKRSYYMNYKDV